MIKTTAGKTIEGWDLLNDAYAAIVTERGSEDGWVPSAEISEDDAEKAITEATRDLGGSEYTHALVEMILDGGLENDPVFEQIEAAAARAFAAFAEEMDNEAEQQGLA